MKIKRDNLIMIDLKDIDDRPGPYCMSFHFDLAPLIRSIEQFGLLNRPLVTKTKTEVGRVEVVAGYRRVLALKALEKEKVACMDLSNSGFSSLDFLLLNLSDNLTTREFNDVEKAMILSRLVEYIPKERVLKAYMPLLKLPSHEETLHIYLGLETLDHSLKTAVAEKVLSLKAARLMLELDHETRSSIFFLLSNLRFNFNNQIQLIEYLVDISSNEGIEISDLIQGREIQEILEDKHLTNPQKIKRIMNALRARLYPRLSYHEEVFQKKLSRLGLPKGVKVYHSPFFESPDYRLEIRFKNGKELKDKIEILSHINELRNIVKL